MRTRRRSGGRRGKFAPAATAAFVIVLMLALSGVSLIAATGNHNSGDLMESPRSTEPAGEPLTLESRSRAKRLIIPAIGVKTRLVRLQTTPEDTIELPPSDGAGWYTESVSPGEPGLIILAGYIRRSAHEPGVFLQLRKLREGDAIRIRRKDHRVAAYEVTSIKAYGKKKFPIEKFYADAGEPILRIVTTGGKIRPRAPQGNVIVEASLVDVR